MTQVVRRIALPAALLFLASSVTAQSTIRQQGVCRASSGPRSVESELRIHVAIVLPDMSIRSIPLYELQILNLSDTTVRIGARTELTGSVSQRMCSGRYAIRSVAPVSLNDSTYSWSIETEVQANGASVELTNVNAVKSAVLRKAARQVAPEREVFEQVKRGVFRVEAGLGHGSGFLALIPGVAEPLVVTNDHVVANDTSASIYLDSVTRVPAVVVARDRDADIATLRLPTGRCGECPRLQLGIPKGADPLVVAGERVLAIGFPLNQEMTLTTGIVSSVRDGAIISDVNINHGNSGGPMINLAGEVVGINAFGDFTSQGGPGISGAIAITRISRLIDSIPGRLAQVTAPPDRTMPAVPRGTYPLALLRQAADSADPKAYRKLLERSANKFMVNITTPVLYRVAQKIAENEVAGERKQREKRGGVSKDEGYSEMKQSRDWEQYVGDLSVPVVTIAITPKVGETFGSAFLRGLAASGGGLPPQASYVYQGDVRGARFYRNGVEVEPIRGGHGPQVARVENAWVKLKDVADMGYYVLSPEAFEPDSDGTPATLTVIVKDLKNPGSLSVTEIDRESSARVWNDFQPYFASVAPSKHWVMANPEVRSKKVKLECDSYEGVCRVAGK